MVLNRSLNDQEYRKFVNIGDNETAARVLNTTLSSNKLNVSEVLTLVTGAGNTTGTMSTDKAPIFNALGTHLGSVYDTSVTFSGGTGLVSETAYRKDLTDVEQLALLSHGIYAIDYDTGKIRYKKDNSQTSITCSYLTRQLNVELTTGSASITIGNVVVSKDVNPNLVSNPLWVELTDGASALGTVSNPMNVTGEASQGNLPQSVMTLSSGSANYITCGTSTGTRNHVTIILESGTGAAIVSLDSGTTDHLYIPQNSISSYDDLLISDGATIKVKNAVSANVHGLIYVTLW